MNGARKKVLVMDDEHLIRESMLELLTACGFSADGAADGEQALQLYRDALMLDERYDAVILDIRVPGGMDGRAVVDEIRRMDPHMRAIASSGYSDANVLSCYQDFGFCQVLSKPFTCQELVAAVQHATSA